MKTIRGNCLITIVVNQEFICFIICDNDKWVKGKQNIMREINDLLMLICMTFKHVIAFPKLELALFKSISYCNFPFSFYMLKNI